jgi:LacI family transcriptional regulator
MKKLVMRDIAAALDCSITQVSRALAGKPKVAPEIRRRILEYAIAHNYRNTARCHIRNFAVITDHHNNFSSGVINELIRISSDKRFHFAVLSGESLGMLSDKHFDGAISIQSKHAGQEWAHRFNIPMVEINSSGCLLEHISSVSPDSDHEAYQALEHLVGLGHRKIARIRVSVSSLHPATIGAHAFMTAAEKFGIQDQVTQRFFNDIIPDELFACVGELLLNGFTAFIFVGTSECEKLFIPIIEAHHRKVPEDVSVIGYKNEIYKFNWQYSQLTCFSFDFSALTQSAIALLLDELSGKIPCRKLIPSIFNPGKTTAPPGKNMI